MIGVLFPKGCSDKISEILKNKEEKKYKICINESDAVECVSFYVEIYYYI